MGDEEENYYNNADMAAAHILIAQASVAMLSAGHGPRDSVEAARRLVCALASRPRDMERAIADGYDTITHLGFLVKSGEESLSLLASFDERLKSLVRRFS